MKFFRFIVLVLATAFICISTPAFSQEFKWVSGFNEQANFDIDEFKRILAERFRQKLGEINPIFKEMKTPSDTYMAYKLSEMSKRPVSDVVKVYGNGKSKGWGALAKRLGIKPGSKEFHELKRQDDLYHGRYNHSDDDSDYDARKKGKGKGKKNKGKDHKKSKKKKTDNS